MFREERKGGEESEKYYEEQLNEPKLLTLGERKIFNYFKYWLDVKRKRNIERKRKRMKPKRFGKTHQLVHSFSKYLLRTHYVAGLIPIAKYSERIDTVSTHEDIYRLTKETQVKK